MISDDIETFNNNEQATEFKQGIDAVYDSSCESDNAEIDIIDDFKDSSNSFSLVLIARYFTIQKLTCYFSNE